MKKTAVQTDTAPLAANICDLYLQFPRQQELLFEELSIEIYKGENVLLLGPSGSGKSTLLKVLTGLIPDSVEVPVQWNKCNYFNSWGYVFQDPDAQFCMPYVDEEIAFVLENRAVPADDMPKYIFHYLGLVGLTFDEPHRPIKKLSQGQKQRLALASCLALEPETLVLDEPTALLDPKGTKMIWEKVRNLSSNKTLLIVEHKIKEIIDLIDRVLVLDDQGQLILNETPDRIKQNHQSLLDQYGIWHQESWSNYNQQSEDLQLSKEEVQPKSNEPLLEIDHLEGYHNEIMHIGLSDLQIYPGEWVAITGQNGSGKSTLLQALMQLIEQKGTIRFCGKEITSTEQLAADIGFVFQNPELQFVAQSVREEIAFTLNRQCPRMNEQEVERNVAKSLQQYGHQNVAEQNPHQLSTGQQRRLSIAAATVKKRKLLLLDEPTFGQDAVNTFAILEQLEAYRKSGAAILMVTHDMQVVQQFATRRWNIAHGTLQFDCSGQRREVQKTEESNVV